MPISNVNYHDGRGQLYTYNLDESGEIWMIAPYGKKRLLYVYKYDDFAEQVLQIFSTYLEQEIPLKISEIIKKEYWFYGLP